MKHKEIERLFTGKLSMKKNNNKRHEQFCFQANNGNDIPFPQVFCLSRGGGEVAKNNLASLANMMGMSHKEFETATKCNIGPTACVLGMVVSILRKAKIEIENDPIANNWDSTLLLYIPTLLKEASDFVGKKNGKFDESFIGKLITTLRSMNRGSRGAFKEHVRNTLKIAESIGM
jgi:hypothetical protein